MPRSVMPAWEAVKCTDYHLTGDATLCKQGGDGMIAARTTGSHASSVRHKAVAAGPGAMQALLRGSGEPLSSAQSRWARAIFFNGCNRYGS